MNFKKILMGGALSLALLSLFGCKQELNEETPKIKIEFSQEEVQIPANGTSAVLIKVDPSSRAEEITLTVADESVVSIDGTKTETTDEGIKVTLVPHSISSTTLYAIHPDLEQTPECRLTVTPVAMTGLGLDKSELRLKVGEESALSPVITPEDVTSPAFTWKSDDESVATVSGGIVKGVKEGKTTVTVSSGEFSASCEVTVYAVYATGLKLYWDGLEIGDDETLRFFVGEQIKIDAEILPEDATYRTVSRWMVRDMDQIDTATFHISDKESGIYVTGKLQGYTAINAFIDVPGLEKPIQKHVEIEVLPKTIPTGEAKIGDYFYSDGTWSDGGFLGFDGEGFPMWARVKPAPESGKKVIGIVFQTDPSRISQTEKDAGFTHGLVLCLKAAHAPVSSDPDADHKLDYLTRFCGDSGALTAQALRHLSRGKSVMSYYGDIEGYAACHGIYDEFNNPDMGEKNPLADYSAIDWTMRGFAPAPAETSGWYVPSSGQLWDFFYNLGGDEVRMFLDEHKESSTDLSWGERHHVNNDPMTILDYHWGQIPSGMREAPVAEFKGVTSKGEDGKTFTYKFNIYQFLTCSLYDEESVRIFEIATSLNSYVNNPDQTEKFGGDFLPSCDWVNQPMHCYPVLSF